MLLTDTAGPFKHLSDPEDSMQAAASTYIALQGVSLLIFSNFLQLENQEKYCRASARSSGVSTPRPGLPWLICTAIR